MGWFTQKLNLTKKVIFLFLLACNFQWLLQLDTEVNSDISMTLPSVDIILSWQIHCGWHTFAVCLTFGLMLINTPRFCIIWASFRGSDSPSSFISNIRHTGRQSWDVHSQTRAINKNQRLTQSNWIYIYGRILPDTAYQMNYKNMHYL